MSEPPARGVLFDFGGVLTSSVLAGFSRFSVDLGADPGLVLRLLSTDPDASGALVAHEEGRLDDEGFEDALGAALDRAGIAVDPDGLIARMQTYFVRDEEMVGLVAVVRVLGHPVGLISNSLGRDCYAGYDLDAMFDAQTISSAEGVRKPSRRLYEIACERLALAPHEVVIVDDLRQNVDAATRLGMRGIVHRDADTTRTALADALGVAPDALTTGSATAAGTDHHPPAHR